LNKVICFGDVHFSSINTWNYKAGEHFIKWFEQENFGNKDEIEMIFVGDIAERDVNPGNVVDQMWRLFESASHKAKSVYVVCGNHDKKLYHDIEQHSLKFLTNLPNVHVFEKETELVTENGYKVLVLPWQAKSSEGITLHDYYNKLSENYKDKTYDIITGHWNIKETTGPAWAQDGVDLTNLHAKCYAIGHIHLRIRDEYIGSIFPNSIAEQNDSYPRGYKIYENGQESFKLMPRFLKYVTLKLGDELPNEDTNCSYAYIITNCNTEVEAKEKYPDVCIKGIERVPTRITTNTQVCTDGDAVDLSQFSNTYISDLPKAFAEMIKESGITVSRSTYSLVNSVIS
jgi:DNA repair exonuclease SbcCD nuclease subunit